MRAKTGWEDIDALLIKADELGEELKEIQLEAADILYPAATKPADNPKGKKLVKSA